MIPVYAFRGKKVAVFGLGGSGLATAAALAAGGADVLVWDDNADVVELARGQGFVVADLRAADWAGICALVLSPGVPFTYPRPHWSVELARARGVEIIGDIELFVRERSAFLEREGLAREACALVAITGTNGKSTTTALVSHLLETAGCDVCTGGNIGTAILSLEAFASGRFYVIECSSYQIDLAPSLNPSVGIVLNLTPDHIDRHGSFAHYAAIKQRLAASADAAIIGIDDAPSRRIYQRLHAIGRRVAPVTVGAPLQEGYFSCERTLFRAQGGRVHALASLKQASSLRGGHNEQNALAALACCDFLGVALADRESALASFKGLPHRMEEVRRKGHVLFINDSKATNAEATAPALAAFDHIYWIAGGVAKEGGIHALGKFFPKIRKAYLIGAAASVFAQTIGAAVPVSMAGTLADAVREVARDAGVDKAGGEAVVLLSPACASFDQFANYAMRGDAFRKLVEQI